MWVSKETNGSMYWQMRDRSLELCFKTKLDCKGGLAIVAMRHWSQGPLQSPIEIVKNRGCSEELWGPFEFFCMDGRRGLLIPVCFCWTDHCEHV
jgi:hypothetical protein